MNGLSMAKRRGDEGPCPLCGATDRYTVDRVIWCRKCFTSSHKPTSPKDTLEDERR